MSRGAGRKRALVLLSVALVAAAAGIGARAVGALDWLQERSVDARFSLRGSAPPLKDLVLVGIDNKSIGELPNYPWSRTLDARVLENLHAAGARLVVYDVAFDRPTTESADWALYEAGQRASPVVFATSLISSSGGTEVLGGNANLAAIHDRAGAADLVADGDGAIRHMTTSVSGLPTIANAVWISLGHRALTNDGLHGGWIDFRGPPRTFPTLSFVDVLHGHFARNAVRGKIVVIGATAPSLQDLHTTSVGGPMSGPEVQANAIATVLGGFPLRSPEPAVTVILIIALALIVPLVGLRLGTLGAAVVAFVVLCCWSLATQLVFNAGVVLDYSDPLASLVVGTTGTVLIAMWADTRERKRLREAFAADAEDLVEHVLNRPDDRPIEPTAIIAGYQLESVLGRGGMGVVYKARQLDLDRGVAIKLIAAAWARDSTFRERFATESRIAASIEHPNVIPVYEAGDDDGLLYIVMRLVDGLDLAQLVESRGPLEPERALGVISQVGAALDAAHALGLVHRDVKPGNVMLTMEVPPHVYLTDFGLAKHVTDLSRVTRVGSWVGTLDYLAPELIRGETVTASADIYALTGLLYYCLVGEAPFPRSSEAATLWAHVNEPPPSVAGARDGLPAELDAVIARGMAKDPSLRFASAGRLAEAFANVLGVPYVRAEPVGERATRERGRSRRGGPTVVSD
jgi:CHASE2 domain-containing sensor protein/predicted Ser/Thr protein kinase